MGLLEQLELVFYYEKMEPASWSSGNAFVAGTGSLRFKSWAVQIGHRVANSSPPLRHFFERSCVAGSNGAEMDPAKLLHASA